MLAAAAAAATQRDVAFNEVKPEATADNPPAVAKPEASQLQ